MEVIKVVPNRPEFLEIIQNGFDALSPLTKTGFVVAAPAALVVAVAFGLEAAALAGGASVIMGLIGAISDPQNLTERLKTPEELASVIDLEGNQLKVGERYIAHPKRKNVFLFTENYHHDIIREQQQHLISFIRSELAVSRLQIAISYEDDKGVEIKSPWISLNPKQNLSGSILCDLSYSTPTIIAPTENLFWLDHFSNVRAGLKQGGAGKKIFVEKLGKNLSCSIEMAEKLGFKAEACKSYSLSILVET